MKMHEMTPKEKTAAFETYCRINESSDICFNWRTKRNQFSGKWMFTLTIAPAPRNLKLYATTFYSCDCTHGISYTSWTKHAVLDFMFSLVMGSRSTRDLSTVESFEEMAMINAITVGS